MPCNYTTENYRSVILQLTILQQPTIVEICVGPLIRLLIKKSSRNASSSSSRHFKSKYHQDKTTGCNEPTKDEIDKWIHSTYMSQSWSTRHASFVCWQIE